MDNTNYNNISADGTNTNVNPVRNRPNRQGANNPMYGRHHSQATRQKQSDAAKRRNLEYKKALDSQHHITMDEFLSNNPQLDIKGYVQHLVKEEVIKQIIRESIEDYLKKDQNRRISIPII